MEVALAVTVAVVAALVRWTEGKLSCEFGWRDMCDWTSVTKETNTLEWIAGRFRKNSNYDWNYYAHLDVSGHHAGDQGVLASPWLQARPPGYQCRLQFQYYLEKDNGCRLSLLHEKAGIVSVLWNSTTASYFVKTFSSYLDCTGDQHKLYFKGERISNRDYACGDNENNEIDVDNIVYLVVAGEPPPTSPPTTATTSTLTTTSTFSSTSEGGSTASDTLTSNNTGGLSTASIAGTIIAVILVVVVIAVVVIFVSRRRDGDGDKTPTWLARYFRKTKPLSASLNNTRRAVSNSGYVPDDQIITSDQGDPVGFSNPHNQNNDQVLAVVLVGQANPYETLNTDDNESRPYEILPGQTSPYETLSRGNRDSNAYDILFAGRQDSDGYELPVATPANNRAALQDKRNHDYNN